MKPTSGIYIAMSLGVLVLARPAETQPTLNKNQGSPPPTLFIADEEFSLPGNLSGDSGTVDLEYSSEPMGKTLAAGGPATQRTWNKVKTRIPNITGRLPTKIRLPSAVRGDVRIRLKDSDRNRIHQEFQATILPPAGSAVTGPFLKADPRWDSGILNSLEPGGDPQSIKAFRQSIFRLGKAKGASICLNSAVSSIKAAMDSLEAYRFTLNAAPIVVSQVHFHYQMKDVWEWSRLSTQRFPS